MHVGEVINIAVCYYNANEVKEYAKVMNNQINVERFTLVIVVNAAAESDFLILNSIEQEVFYTIMVVNPKNNLGYMNGLLYGYSAYKKEHGSPEYVIMGNTDIEIPDITFLDKFITKEYDESIWCIGPSIYTKNTHNYDNPVAIKRRTEKEIKSLIRRFGFPLFGTLYVWMSLIKAKVIKKKKMPYELHGCYFIVTSKCADKMLKRPFNPLMYSEETYVAEIIRESRKKEYYDSELEVIHREHTTTSLLGNRKIAKHLCESMKYIRNEFYKDEK